MGRNGWIDHTYRYQFINAVTSLLVNIIQNGKKTLKGMPQGYTYLRYISK